MIRRLFFALTSLVAAASASAVDPSLFQDLH